MSLFKNQTLIDLTLNTGIEITGYSAIAIKYEKPSGVTGQWTAQANGINSIKYPIADENDLDESGEWKFQAVVTIGGRTGYGEIVRINVREPI